MIHLVDGTGIVDPSGLAYTLATYISSSLFVRQSHRLYDAVVQSAGHGGAAHQGGLERDRVDLPVLPPLRRERGAAATACPGPQARQFSAHPDLARGSQPLVKDHLAGPTGQHRRQDRQVRAIDHVSDGRGHGLARVVPEYPRRHCVAASAAAGAMLSAAVTACVDCRQGNCVHFSLDPAKSPAGRQSLTGGAGRGRRPGTFAVATAVGRRVACFLDGRVGRPSGECRSRSSSRWKNASASNSIRGNSTRSAISGILRGCWRIRRKDESRARLDAG